MTGFPIEYWSIGGILKGVGGYVVSKVPVTWGGGGRSVGYPSAFLCEDSEI
jgi:hypothetical protein